MTIEIIPEKPMPVKIRLQKDRDVWVAEDKIDNICIQEHSNSTLKLSGYGWISIPKSEFKEFVRAIEKEFIDG